MRTPEGAEKDLVKQYLDAIGAYQFWPVQTGRGKATIDCLASIGGFFIGIETKAPGGDYTARQKATMREIVKSGGGVFGGTASQIIEGIEKWRFKK